MVRTRIVLRSVALVAAISVLAACSDAPSSDVAPLPVFDGVGDFYDVPDPLPPGEPGELIRVEPIELRGNEERSAMRVMYHTRDSFDRDIAATGVVTYPLGDAPDGG